MEKDFSLLEYNTFGFNVTAKYFLRINDTKELKEVIDNEAYSSSRKFILGGGSNVLFKDEYFDGVIIHLDNKGIKTLEENADKIKIRVCGGEIWKDFVNLTVAKGYYGLENLSDIPGSVGASPVQNIGSYGAEVKNCIHQVHAIDINNGKTYTFNNNDCHFSYRNSIFKTEEYKRFLIYSVDFMLQKRGTVRTDYGNIKDFLMQRGVTSPCISDVANAIKETRANKLPEVGVIGSAGSFFQNAIVTQEVFDRLKFKYHDIPSYPETDGRVKIPTGWFIEKAGWKGHREGNVGVWDKQALVLVHYGKGNSKELLALMNKIQDSVKKEFGIDIQPEVNIV